MFGFFTFLKLGKVEENICMGVSREKINRRTNSRGTGRCRNSDYQVCPDRSFPNKYEALADKTNLAKKNKMMKLNLKLDSGGHLCSDGRLKYAENLPYDVRFPVMYCHVKDG